MRVVLLALLAVRCMAQSCPGGFVPGGGCSTSVPGCCKCQTGQISVGNACKACTAGQISVGNACKACTAGQSANSALTACIDVNECAATASRCKTYPVVQTCVDTVGSFVCLCPEGMALISEACADSPLQLQYDAVHNLARPALDACELDGLRLSYTTISAVTELPGSRFVATTPLFTDVMVRVRKQRLSTHVSMAKTTAVCLGTRPTEDCFRYDSQYVLQSQLNTSFPSRTTGPLSTDVPYRDRLYVVDLYPTDVTDSWWSSTGSKTLTNVYMSNTYTVELACDCGFALYKTTDSQWACQPLYDKLCPPGWEPKPNANPLQCTRCQGNTYKSNAIGNCIGFDCTLDETYYTDLTVFAPTKCIACRTSCTPERGYTYDTTYKACLYGKTYDAAACSKLTLLQHTCGLASSVQGATRDNECKKMSDVISEPACANGTALFLEPTHGFFSTVCKPCGPLVLNDNTYLAQCSANQMFFGNCTSIAPRDYASTGYYHPREKCLGVGKTGAIGPGDAVPCNTPLLVQSGKFVLACGDATGGPVYADCLQNGSVCLADQFQITCGRHYTESDVVWGIDDKGNLQQSYEDLQILRPTTHTVRFDKPGSVGYGGTCVSCAAWAPTACALGGQFLTQCGQAGKPLVNAATLRGNASGVCKVRPLPVATAACRSY